MTHWYRWLLTFCLGFALAGMFLAVKRAYSGAMFPPLAYIAAELGIGRGSQLPKGVIYNGRPFFFYIINAQEHPGGRYTVEIQAQ